MTTALGSFGDLNIAAKYLKQVDSDGYLTENIAGSFLHNAYKTHTAEEVAATYSNTTASFFFLPPWTPFRACLNRYLC